jgi:hypothetical protein
MFPHVHSRLLRDGATLAGIGLIAFAVFRYGRLTPFPGLAALIPCIGSALIIGTGESGSSLVSSVLSWKPVVFVGLISYSLYLWHWPVIILHSMGLSARLQNILPDRYASLFPFLRFDMLMEILASFVLAVLSWRFVERPFRSRPMRVGQRPLFALSATVIMALIAFSGSVISTDGFPGRFSPQSVKIASFLSNRDGGSFGRVGGCFITESSRSTVLDNDHCLQLVNDKKNYLLIGDSLAGALWSGLSNSLPADHILLASVSNCKPFVSGSGTFDCRKEMNYIFQTYLPNHKVDELFLEAHWRLQDMGELTETIAWAKDHHVPVTVFGPVAEYDAPLPRLLAYSVAWNEPDMARHHRLTSRKPLDQLMQLTAASTWHVPYISLYSAICSGNTCLEYADAEHKVPIMNDEVHLNEFGSALVAKRLIESGELH